MIGIQFDFIFRGSVRTLAAAAAFTAIAAQTAVAQQPYLNAFVPTARTEQSAWKYTTDDPGQGWDAAAFDDAAWNVGAGGFGTAGTPGAVIGTEWNGPYIWLRKTVNIPSVDELNGLSLLVHHDENVDVYVNGKLVLQETGYSTDYKSHVLDLEARNAFVTGDNVIAVYCAQTEGGQYIDVGLESVITGSASVLLADARTEAPEWKYTTDDPGTSTWTGEGFDDAAWSSATGGFGSLGTAGALVGKEWLTSDIWLRRTFNVGEIPFNNFFVTIHHDEDVSVFINGVAVLRMTGYASDYTDVDITASAKQVIKQGENTIAVYCHNTGGGQYVDVGLFGLIVELPVGLRKADKRIRAATSPRVGRLSGLVLFQDGKDGSVRMFGANGKRVPPQR